jgi:teichuronic acid biosynthesis glycosyltransferase TuaH
LILANDMGNQYDVILIGLSRWDNILNSSLLNIASEWAKTHRVFYIDRPFSVKDYFVKREKEALKRSAALLFGKNKYRKVSVHGQEIIAVTPSLSLPINFLPEGAFYNFLHTYNKQIISKAIASIIKDYEVKDYVFFNSFIPEYFDVLPVKMKQPILKIYRSSDDISQEPYIAKHGVKKEAMAIKEADLVLVSSYGLQKKLAQIKEPIYRIPNAARYEMFSNLKPIQKPLEMAHLTGKIIFLSGNISHLRIDYNLLHSVSKEFPAHTLLIAGPYNLADLEAAQLLNCSNIKWLGPLRLEEVAQMLAFIDCAIIPFLCNTLTMGIYPLKINEYLAAGKPVVSTCFSEDILTFSSCIYLAKNTPEFLAQIKLALAEPNSQELKDARQRLAKSNNWANRMNEMLTLINLKIAEKQLKSFV